MAASNGGPVKDWKLERFVLGELPRHEHMAIESIVAEDADCAARLSALRQSNRDILSTYDPAAMTAQIRGRVHMAEVSAAHSRRRGRQRLALTLVLSVSTATAAVLVAVNVGNQAARNGLVGDDAADGIRVKGHPQLVVFRQKDGVSEEIKNNGAARRGDVLQVSYRVSEPCYGAVFSIDGRGSLTWHFPDGELAAPLKYGELTALSHAYELDDAPLVERFFLVTSSEPFAVAPIINAAELFGRQPAAVANMRERPRFPAGIEQTSIVVRKEETP